MSHTFRSFSPTLSYLHSLFFPLIGAVPLDTAPGPGAGRTDLPVSMVVLFSSGVGYFEHSGTVQGNSSVELRFKSSQINDILKSLVLEDLNGGRIGAIGYPSQEPVEEILRNFQVDITSNPSLPDCSTSLEDPGSGYGSRRTDRGHYPRPGEAPENLQGQDHEVIDDWMFNIMSGAAVRSVRLDDVQKIELRDPKLQVELQKALFSLAEARNQDKKPILINFHGDGNRTVRLRYVIETPIWKTSYRLILPQRRKAAPSCRAGPLWRIRPIPTGMTCSFHW